MQISDLNNNLLNMIAGKNSQKTVSEDGTRFSELLSAVGNTNKESVKNNEYSADAEDKIFKTEVREVDTREKNIEDSEVLSNPEEGKKTGEKETAVKENSAKETDAKEVDNKDVTSEKADNNADNNKETNNEKTNNEKTVDDEPIDKVSSPKKVEEENNIEEVFIENFENNVIEVKENEISKIENVLPIVPVVVSENENQFEVVSEIVEADSNILPENVLSVPLPENTETEIQKIVPAENNEVKEATPIISEKNVSDIRVRAELPEQEVVVDNNEIISVQEEKIAELLPEGKKIEIKVNTTKDVVVEKIETKNNDLLPLIDEEAVKDIVSDVENHQELVNVSEDQPVEKVEVQQQPNITYIEAKQPLEVVDEITKPTSSVTEVSHVSEIVSEVKPLAETADRNVLRNVENKGLTREIAEQIKVNITQSAIKGVDKVEIQLKPADLGKIEIKLQIGRDGRLQAHIVASNAETLELLQKDLTSLKEAFNNAGYLTEDESFSFSYRGENQENSERQQLREFIGEIITHDVEEEMAANDYISADGVNIRV